MALFKQKSHRYNNHKTIISIKTLFCKEACKSDIQIDKSCIQFAIAKKKLSNRHRAILPLMPRTAWVKKESLLLALHQGAVRMPGDNDLIIV